MKAPRNSSSSCTDLSAASALARASRVAQARGSSPRLGVSSSSAGRSASGSMPIWLMSETRRGEPEARTNLDRPIMLQPFRPTGRRPAIHPGETIDARDSGHDDRYSLEPIGDAALGQVVGRHLDQNLVAGQNADAILAHAA